ncbi:hypothetical protein N7520_004409 [Penicillium odoratum]|uniref:uncharacterized protein n=1 Tax=Penicillium odoratum TaxID=1167516 RepID=UPI002547F0DB|nr:uncharacterized protein N7520_004409 [Penicillium odoratum]KAJ5764850.1 hypothetical protein N7520_004409 [Penicillium odoratum]
MDSPAPWLRLIVFKQILPLGKHGGLDGFVSTYFNMTEPTTTTTTTTAATATSINTSNLATQFSLTTATGPAASSSANPDSSTSLTTTNKIALGIEVGVCIPPVYVLEILICLRARQVTSKDKVNSRMNGINTAPMAAPLSDAEC